MAKENEERLRARITAAAQKLKWDEPRNHIERKLSPADRLAVRIGNHCYGLYGKKLRNLSVTQMIELAEALEAKAEKKTKYDIRKDNIDKRNEKIYAAYVELLKEGKTAGYICHLLGEEYSLSPKTIENIVFHPRKNRDVRHNNI